MDDGLCDFGLGTRTRKEIHDMTAQETRNIDGPLGSSVGIVWCLKGML